jgi:RNA polymerase sigma-19 factor, ECF subfamily
MYAPKTGEAHSVSLPLAVSADDRRRLMQFIERRVPNPADAADLFQEVFARALRVKRAELVKSPLKYLYGIAWKVMSDFIQAEKRRARVICDSQMAQVSSEESPRALADALAVQEAFTAQLDAERALEQAIDRLPDTHKNVLLLTSRDGLSHAEAAEALGLSVHTIKKYAYEAKALLRMTMPVSNSAVGEEQT